MSALVSLLKPIVERSPTLASLYRALREDLRFRREPRPTSLGFRFSGNRIMESGAFEEVETMLVRRLLDDTAVMVNVGANIGYYCCLALSRGKHVVAFEPMSGNQRFLYRNVRANAFDATFECFPIALADAPGLCEIYGGGTGASLVAGWAGQSDSRIVPVSTLDLVLGDRFRDTPTLIVIDIEGAELAMLRGATRRLAADHAPVWFVEISVTEHQPAGIAVNPHLLATFRLFADHGYAAITADRSPRRVDLAEVAAIERTGADTLQTHNFIFVREAASSGLLERLRDAAR